MSRLNVGDRLPDIPESTWKRLGRVEPNSGPRCYICNRYFREGDKMAIVAVGPGDSRERFAVPIDGGSDCDSVRIGAECVRRYVPEGSIMEVQIR